MKPADSHTAQPPVRHASEVAFEIWKSGPVSKAALATSLRLSLPTISTAIRQLEQHGIINTAQLGPSTGGRKARLIDIQPDIGHVIGVSFTSRGIAAATGNMKGRLRNIRKYPFDLAQGKDAALRTLEKAITDQLVLETNPPLQVGLTLSGLLDRKRGVSLAFPRFEEWVNVPLAQHISRKFDIPTTLDSHIAGTTLAELLFGNYREFNNALYVQLGPGLGMGIITGGRLYRGSGPNVGEFGHISMREEGGTLCYCGNYGCLESLAGDHAIVQQAQEGLRQGVQSRLSEQAADNAAGLNIRHIFEAAASDDRFARNLVDRAARLLATGIANVTNILAPDHIILGGTMMNAGEDLLIDSIRTTLHTKALNRVEEHVQISKHSFGKDDTVIGAVATALYQYFSEGNYKWKLS